MTPSTKKTNCQRRRESRAGVGYKAKVQLRGRVFASHMEALGSKHEGKIGERNTHRDIRRVPAGKYTLPPGGNTESREESGVHCRAPGSLRCSHRLEGTKSPSLKAGMPLWAQH